MNVPRGVRIAAFVIGLTMGLLLSACSGKGGTAQTETRANVAGVELLVPAGWSYGETSDGALVVAEIASDVEADVPSGPRLVADRSDSELPDPADLFATSREQQSIIRGEPQEVSVDGRPGVAIETASVLDGIPIVSRVTAVGGDEGAGYTLTEEAPEAQWDSSSEILAEILSSIRFGGGGGTGVVVLFVLLAALGIGATGYAGMAARRRKQQPVAARTDEAAPGAIPAGWYPDPAGEARQRYWDGEAWTDHVAD